MTKKKVFVFTALLICLFSLSAFNWVYKDKIISGNYDMLTITIMGHTEDIIKNKEEIDKKITRINNSPRRFHPNIGFRYDHLPHGLLIFENVHEKVSIGFILPQGNVLTKFWEFETNFNFEEEKSKTTDVIN